MKAYFRPLAQTGERRPEDALPLAGGACWFTHAERLERGQKAEIIPADEVPQDMLARLTGPRAPLGGLDMSAPKIMGILNVTPDSFSDGGDFGDAERALEHVRQMCAAGADIIDIGGESTRPGAAFVPADEETARVMPAICAVRGESEVAISIDTRKAAVAEAALDGGATIVNDVSGFTYDPALAGLCAARGAPVCIMHSQGDPETMQDAPAYGDVLLDVYDFLEERVTALEAAGLSRAQMIVDPGIGFGKTQAYNLALLKGLSLFHGLGCAVLLGVSRKGFIGKIGHAPDAKTRAPGSIAVGLAAAAQGVQILRVHDVAETKQALRLWGAVT